MSWKALFIFSVLLLAPGRNVIIATPIILRVDSSERGDKESFLGRVMSKKRRRNPGVNGLEPFGKWRVGRDKCGEEVLTGYEKRLNTARTIDNVRS